MIKVSVVVLKYHLLSVFLIDGSSFTCFFIHSPQLIHLTVRIRHLYVTFVALNRPKNMKKIHIALLVLIAITIAVLISFMGTLSTYDTVQTALKKKGKTVSIIAKL